MQGHHTARCLGCGNQWTVGDCIPTFCSPECESRWREWADRVGLGDLLAPVGRGRARESPADHDQGR